MSNELKGAFAAQIATAYARIVYPITLKRTQLFSPKAAANVAIGAGLISFNTLPVGFDRIKATIDTMVSGGAALKTFSAEVVQVAGTITDAPFAPVTTATITSGATVQITRRPVWTAKGYTRLYGASELIGGITQGQGEAVLVASSLPADYGNPLTSDQVLDRFGHTGTVQQVQYDPELGLWRLQVAGW